MRALSKRAGFASRGRETDVMREAFGVKLYTLQEAAEMLGASVARLHAMRRLECTFLNCTTLLVKGTSGHLKHRGGGISLSGMFH